MKWKAKLVASLKIWVVIYPALTLFLYLFKERLSAMPVYLRPLSMTLTLVPLTVFVGLPVVDFIIRIISPEERKA